MDFDGLMQFFLYAMLALVTIAFLLVFVIGLFHFLLIPATKYVLEAIHRLSRRGHIVYQPEKHRAIAPSRSPSSVPEGTVVQVRGVFWRNERHGMNTDWVEIPKEELP